MYKLNANQLPGFIASKAYLDAAVARVEIAGQIWLPAVNAKAELPGPATLSPAANYLCRVINDTEAPANNEGRQFVASAWTYFPDNLDFVNEAELAAAVGGQNTSVAAHSDIRQAAIGAQSAITAHKADKANPRGVTKAQAGLDSVDNTARCEQAGVHGAKSLY